MANKLIDLTGQRFGRWTVIGHAERKQDGHRRWLCRCQCGVETDVREDLLKNSKSSGCRKCSNTIYSSFKTRDEKNENRQIRLYRIWIAMKARCENPANNAYRNYGGRGITVCAEWKYDFQAFYAWSMENGYRDDLTIDRIDTDMGYSPNNCRWSTMKTQQSNRRNNRYIEFNGERKTLTQWSEIYRINKSVLGSRLDLGWTMEEALEIIPKKKWERKK